MTTLDVNILETTSPCRVLSCKKSVSLIVHIFMKTWQEFLKEITIVLVPKDADIMRQLDQTINMVAGLEPKHIEDHKAKLIELQKACEDRLSNF